MNADVVNKARSNFELYILSKYSTMKIHFKQDSSNNFMFNFLYTFYPMLSRKTLQIESRILHFYSNLAHKGKKLFS